MIHRESGHIIAYSCIHRCEYSKIIRDGIFQRPTLVMEDILRGRSDVNELFEANH